MKQKVKNLLRFVNRFGFWNGIFLCLKFYTGNVKDIKLPHLKYHFSLRPNSSDIPTFYQVFMDNEYNITLDTKPKLIIDGGANVGLFAVKYINEFPEAKIICIEPDSENFQVLRRNVIKYENIFVENCGLWNKDTILKVSDKFNIGKWGMVVEEDNIHGNVPAISLKTLLDKYSVDCVDILKLDIESSEKQIFSANYEGWLPKVKTIIIELHDWMEVGCSKSFFKAINESFSNYTYSHCGENVIITNKDIT